MPDLGITRNQGMHQLFIFQTNELSDGQGVLLLCLRRLHRTACPSLRVLSTSGKRFTPVIITAMSVFSQMMWATRIASVTGTVGGTAAISAMRRSWKLHNPAMEPTSTPNNSTNMEAVNKAIEDFKLHNPGEGLTYKRITEK